MRRVKRFAYLLWFFLLLLSGSVYGQSIEENLMTLESLIDGSIASIARMESENESLKQALENLEASLRTQSRLLREQGGLLNEQAANYEQQREIYGKQSAYLKSLQGKLKIYKASLMIAVPVCIGFGTWLGWKIAGR
jgi:ABC-type transporter Mla subunit MlaD